MPDLRATLCTEVQRPCTASHVYGRDVPSSAPTAPDETTALPGRPHPASARRRRLLAGAAVAASALALTGCTAHMDMTISAEGTYDVTLDMRDTTGSVFTDSTDCSQYANPSLIGATEDVEVTAKKVGSADDDGGVGCEVAITGVAVPDASDAATGTSAPLVVRDGDLYKVNVSGFDTGSELTDSQSSTAQQQAGASATATSDGDSGEASAAPTASGSAAAGSLNSVVDARVSITFPGAVVDADGGSVSGTTVTWTDANALSDGVTATGYATTDEGRSVWDRFSAWIIAGVVAAGVVVGALAWRRHRR